MAKSKAVRKVPKHNKHRANPRDIIQLMPEHEMFDRILTQMIYNDKRNGIINKYTVELEE